MGDPAALGTPQPDPAPAKPANRGEAEDREQMAKMREEQRTRRLALLREINPQLPEQIEVWKRSFGAIDSSHILGELYIWRGMSRAEYIALMNVAGDKWKNEESIVGKCLLWPEVSSLNWVQLPAGLPTTLSDLILGTSGFGTDDPMPVRL